MKSKSLTLVLFLTLAGIVNAFAQTEAPYSVNVGEFTQLRIKHGIPVDYIQSNDSSGIVTFTGSKEMTEAVTFENNAKGKLSIALEPRTFSGHISRITVRSRHLMSIDNEGDSMVRILDVASCPTFKAKQTGNGSISVRDIQATQVEIAAKLGHGSVVVKGSCDVAKLNCTGTGTISAGDLEAKDVKCTVLGTGTVDCNATASLTIMGAGSGQVLYTGNPADIKNRSAGVKMEAIERQ